MTLRCLYRSGISWPGRSRRSIIRHEAFANDSGQTGSTKSLVSFQRRNSLNRSQGDSIKKAHSKRRGRNVLITRWMNLTLKTRLVLNLGRMHQHHHHHHQLLETVNQLITKYGDDPNYVVQSKESMLHGYLIEDLKKVRDGIYEKRRASTSKQRPTVKLLEWETEGSGITNADELIHQLYVSVGSIRAGNS